MAVIHRVIIGRIEEVEAVAQEIVQHRRLGHRPRSARLRIRVALLVVHRDFQIGESHLEVLDDPVQSAESLVTIFRESAGDE